jgi:hypothetical protein
LFWNLPWFPDVSGQERPCRSAFTLLWHFCMLLSREMWDAAHPIATTSAWA